MRHSVVQKNIPGSANALSHSGCADSPHEQAGSNRDNVR